MNSQQSAKVVVQKNIIKMIVIPQILFVKSVMKDVKLVKMKTNVNLVQVII